MSRPKGSADLLEDRRRRALAFLDAGYSLNEVGRRIGCAAVSVMRWRDARRRHGDRAFEARFSPGRPWKLGERERKRLVRLLLKGSMAQGYRTNRPHPGRCCRRRADNRGSADAAAGSPEKLRGCILQSELPLFL